MTMAENIEEIGTFQDFPKVSSDGHPHEILTIVAITSGTVVAVIVLFILGVMIDCRQKKRHQFYDQSQIQTNEKRITNGFSIFGSRKSLDITTADDKENQISTISSTTIESKFTSASYINEKDSSKLENYIPGVTTLAF